MKTEDRDEQGRFVEGNSGGPGKPKGSISLLAILKRKLAEMDATGDRTVAEALIEDYIAKARAEGDGIAIRDMVDRTDGRPKQGHEVEGSISIIFDREDEDL